MKGQVNKGYRSIGRLPVDLVVGKLLAGEGSMEAFGVTVRMTSVRIRTYTKGTCCVKCQLPISFFSVESQVNHAPEHAPYHLNAYHETEKGELIMMTSDHIVPKSKNGADKDLNNRQPMCYICNQLKGNLTEEELLNKNFAEERVKELFNKKLSRRLTSINKLVRKITRRKEEGSHWAGLEDTLTQKRKFFYEDFLRSKGIVA